MDRPVRLPSGELSDFRLAIAYSATSWFHGLVPARTIQIGDVCAAKGTSPAWVCEPYARAANQKPSPDITWWSITMDLVVVPSLFKVSVTVGVSPPIT